MPREDRSSSWENNKTDKVLELIARRADNSISIDESISILHTYDLVSEIFDKTESKKDISYIRWNLAVNKLKDDYTNNGIRKIAELIFKLSQKYCPVKTGILKRSGHFEVSGDNTARISYDANYAAYVHEIMDNYHVAPTQSKFLEDAAYEIYNHIQIPGQPPLFTFQMIINDGGSICLEINKLDVEQFINNKEIRDSISEVSIDDTI